MSEYSKLQQGYIESVAGKAHQSAVDIIGMLEEKNDSLEGEVSSLTDALENCGVDTSEILEALEK